MKYKKINIEKEESVYSLTEYIEELKKCNNSYVDLLNSCTAKTWKEFSDFLNINDDEISVLTYCLEDFKEINFVEQDYLTVEDANGEIKFAELTIE